MHFELTIKSARFSQNWEKLDAIRRSRLITGYISEEGGMGLGPTENGFLKGTCLKICRLISPISVIAPRYWPTRKPYSLGHYALLP